MTQAFNLSQLANKVNTSGELDATTGLDGTLPIENGGTNNPALAVTAGGALYTDGSKVMNVGAGTTGQVFTSQGASPPIWQSLQSGFSNIAVFTSTGTFTVPTGITKVKVTVVGGGGNGGNAQASSGNRASGGGGGGGGSAIKIVSGLTPLTTISVTVGGAGLTSSFGAYCSATGGSSGNTTTGASGGVGASGDINISGQGGAAGYPLTSLNTIVSGNGGASIMGGGGAGRQTAGPGNNGGLYGGGGSGALSANSTTQTRGDGASGIVIVEY